MCSLFFPFSGVQELSNEPHIVWFRGVLTFNPKYVVLTHFLAKNFFHYFFRFLGPKSFRMSPILYGLDDFWHLTPNMSFWPTFWKNFFFFFFRNIWDERRILSYSASFCDVCIVFYFKNRSRPIRGRKKRSRFFNFGLFGAKNSMSPRNS